MPDARRLAGVNPQTLTPTIKCPVHFRIILKLQSLSSHQSVSVWRQASSVLRVVTRRICLNKPPLQAAFYGVFRNKFEQKIRQNLEQNFLAAPIRSKPAPTKGSA